MEARSIVVRGCMGEKEQKEGGRVAVLHLLIEVRAARRTGTIVRRGCRYNHMREIKK